MRKHFLSLVSAATCAAAISLAAQQSPVPDPTGPNSAGAATSPAGSGGNRNVPQVPAGPAPRLPDGSIDLTGVWQGGGPIGDLAQGLAQGETIPLLPEAKTIMDARKSGDDPEANCLPTGVPTRRAVSVAHRSGAAVQEGDSPLLSLRRQHPQLPSDLHGRPQAS